MKKRILALALIIGLIMCDCAKQDNTENSSEKEPEKKAEVVKEDTPDEKDAIDDIEGISMSQTISLTDLTNEVYFFSLEDTFGSKPEYTLEEFIEGIREANFIGTDSEIDVETQTIDCGEDGSEETLLSIFFYSIGYRVLCVMTESGDVYNIRYIVDQGQLDDVSIDESGKVIKSVSVEANIRNQVCGHLDEEYNDVFDYGVYYYLAAGAFDKIDATGEEWDEVQICEYYFTSEEDAEKYYTYESFDDAIDSDTLYDKNGVYYQAFAKAGLKVCTQEEIDQMLK